MHRQARLVAIGTLSLLAIVVAGLVAWMLYVHATWDFTLGHLDRDRNAQSFIGRSLRLITQHKHFTAGAAVAITAVIASGGLVFWMLRRKRWAYGVTAFGALGAIVAAWLVRGEVWDIERATASAKWAAKSPYVNVATTFAISATIVLAILAIAAVLAFVTAPKPPQPTT